VNPQKPWLNHCKSDRQTEQANKSSFPDDEAFLHTENTYEFVKMLFDDFSNSGAILFFFFY